MSSLSVAKGLINNREGGCNILKDVPARIFDQDKLSIIIVGKRKRRGFVGTTGRKGRGRRNGKGRNGKGREVGRKNGKVNGRKNGNGNGGNGKGRGAMMGGGGIIGTLGSSALIMMAIGCNCCGNTAGAGKSNGCLVGTGDEVCDDDDVVEEEGKAWGEEASVCWTLRYC